MNMKTRTLARAILTLAIVAICSPLASAQPEGWRFQDYLNDPAKKASWNKTLADGFKMNHNICDGMKKNGLKLYGDEITAALSAGPFAKPKKPRKLLVLLMYWHDDAAQLQGIVAETVKSMGDKSGAFDTDIVPSLVSLTREQLFSYDAVLVPGSHYGLATASLDVNKVYADPCIKPGFKYYFVYERTEELRKHADAMRQALLEFVESGKGFIAIGAAARSSWPEYQAITGWTNSKYYGSVAGDKHPKSTDVDPLQVVTMAKGHAMTAMVPQDKPLAIHSGLFAPSPDVFANSNNTTLLGAEVKSFPILEKRVSRTWPELVPLTWIRTHGKGRVFCGGFECHAMFLMSPEMQTHLLAGIQYAFGDVDL